MQLIKVSVTLDKIEKPLDPPWRRRVVIALFAMTLAMCVLGLAFHSTAAAVAAFASLVAFMALSVPSWIYLPSAARRFRFATLEEHRDLVRRTEAFNRAWCLAERHDPQGKADAFQAKYRKLRAEVDAYAYRYRAFVAVDLAKAEGVPDRRAVRQDIVDRSKDLVELEAKLDELGEESDPGMRAHARAMRETLEKDCIKANLPLGIVRLRRATTNQPAPLPRAKVISEDRP